MTVLLGTLVILSILSAVRAMIGPSLWDRLLGLNLVTSKLIMLIILVAFVQNQTFYLDVALIYALLSFMGVIFFAIYVQRKGRF